MFKLDPRHYILNPKKGFTLVELMIVVAIISILTSVAYVSFNVSQNKSRDSKRKQDLKAVSSALVSYYGDNDAYPPSCTPSSCTSIAQYTSDGSSPWIPELTSNYIQKLPRDPKQNALNFILSEKTTAFIPWVSIQKPSGQVAATSTTLLRPNGVGSFTQWQSQFPSSGSHWDKTTTSDSDSTYVLYTGSGRRKEAYHLQDPTFDGTINQINLHFQIRLETSGSPTFGYGIRLGGGETRTTQILRHTTYQLTSFFNVSRPGGGSWTKSDLNSIEAFVDVDAGERVHLTEIYVEVVYTPSSTPSPTPTPSPITTPTPTPSPAPSPPPSPPPGLAGDCLGKNDVYCYIVSQDRKSFILWAQLDNANDKEAVGKAQSTCNYSSPGGNTKWNYCIESPQ